MLKLILLVSFMFIGTSLWAARLSCDSCGSECAPACGTRRFRTCCFNYLRKKRGPETQALSFDVNAKENLPKPKLPYFNVENIPDHMIPYHVADEYRLYFIEDSVDNRALA